MFDDLDNEVETAEAWVAEVDDKLVGRVSRRRPPWPCT